MDAAGKKAAVAAINGFRAEYQTCLYDAVNLAFEQIKAEGKERRDFTTAVVVLSDGADFGTNLLVKRGEKLMSVVPKSKLPSDVQVMKDNKPVKLGSSITLEELLDLTKFNPEETATRVFTIAYGKDAEPETLDKIARNTRAVMYPSTKGDIERVLKLILQDQ